MATTSAQLAPGLGHVLVEFEYQYEGRDGSLVRIRPNERYELLSKTNSHWWQVRTGPGHKPFYIPAKYVRELPEVPTLFPEKTPAPGPAPLPAPGPAPVPVPVPVLPKTLEETRKPSDQVTIRLRPEGGYRKSENRMSTFGVPLDVDVSMVTSRSPAPRTTNGSGTANMADSHRAPAQGDSGKNSAPTARHHPIPVEMPRAPPTHDVTQETATKTGKEEVEVGPKEDTTAKKGHKEVTTKGHQEAVTIKGEEEEEELVEEEPSESEDEREENSSHIYESIQDLNIDLDALIGRDSTAKQEVESEAPPPAQESGPGPQPKPSESPIYANVISTKKHSTIPPPPSDPAPPAPGPAPSVSGSSSSGLSPASPLSPLDGWQAHTDADSGKLFYFNPLTRKSTWTPPPDLHLDPSHAPSQCADWERLVDEVSGRFYFFNPTTGATSWALPEPQSPPSSTSRPPLPEEDYPQDHPVDDSVFTSNPPLLLPRAHLDPKPDPHRLLELPQRMMGNGVSEEGAASTRGWRHSVAEDRFYPVRRHASDLTDSSKGLAPDGTQLTERLKLKRNLSNRSTHSHQQHGHMLEKAGIINKTKVSDNGKKIRKNWSQSWTVLHGGILTFHRDPKSAPTGASSKASQIVPEFTVELRGASVSWANNKSSKKNVIELKTRQGCEYLMQYDTESIVSDWFKVISDTIRQLDWDHREHQSEDSEDSDRDDKDRKRSSRSSSGADLEQRRVRHKLRRFLQRRPTLQSVKEKGYIRDNVFGCHLDTLCHRENSSVPRFVEKCVRFVERRGLDSDGIYRVSGNLAVIQRLRHKADHEEQLDLEDGQWTEIHVVTGALKLFFRELPEPLFPFSAYNKFIAAIQLPEYSQRVSYIKDLVQTLPLPNHNTMELLFRHLRRVVEHRDQNRMSVQSLAIVFGPTLLRPQVESNLTVHMVFQSQIVELLLNEFCAVFPSSKPDSKIKLTPK